MRSILTLLAFAALLCSPSPASAAAPPNIVILYEGGHRVPFLVKWPGVVKPGSVSDALISQVDLFATLAALVGHALPDRVAEDSHDLLPVWKENAPSPRRSIVHNTFAQAYAVRQDHWLLIANKTGAHSKVPEWFDEESGYTTNEHPGELYDLRADLAQKHNLYAKEPAKVEELTALLESIRAKGQVRWNVLSNPACPRWRMN